MKVSVAVIKITMRKVKKVKIVIYRKACMKCPKLPSQPKIPLLRALINMLLTLKMKSLSKMCK